MLRSKITKLAEKLVSMNGPDRRLDSLATMMLLAPSGARLDDIPGIDGWDIVTGPRGGDANVWLAADEVLYATQFVDAAIELCEKASPETTSFVVLRAVAAIVRQSGVRSVSSGVGGLIARQIVAETLQEVLLASVARAA